MLGCKGLNLLFLDPLHECNITQISDENKEKYQFGDN